MTSHKEQVLANLSLVKDEPAEELMFGSVETHATFGFVLVPREGLCKISSKFNLSKSYLEMHCGML